VRAGRHPDYSIGFDTGHAGVWYFAVRLLLLRLRAMPSIYFGRLLYPLLLLAKPVSATFPSPNTWRLGHSKWKFFSYSCAESLHEAGKKGS
jgi:hypothetical protein